MAPCRLVGQAMRRHRHAPVPHMSPLYCKDPFVLTPSPNPHPHIFPMYAIRTRRYHVRMPKSDCGSRKCVRPRVSFSGVRCLQRAGGRQGILLPRDQSLAMLQHACEHISTFSVSLVIFGIELERTIASPSSSVSWKRLPSGRPAEAKMEASSSARVVGSYLAK